MSNPNINKNEFIADILMSDSLSMEDKKKIQALLIGSPTEEGYDKVFEIIDRALGKALDAVPEATLDVDEEQSLYMDFKVKMDQAEYELDHDLAVAEKEIEEVEELVTAN